MGRGAATFSGEVPICAATSFLKSPIVSSGSHFTRTFLPRRSLLRGGLAERGRGTRRGMYQITSIMVVVVVVVVVVVAVVVVVVVVGGGGCGGGEASWWRLRRHPSRHQVDSATRDRGNSANPSRPTTRNARNLDPPRPRLGPLRRHQRPLCKAHDRRAEQVSRRTLVAGQFWCRGGGDSWGTFCSSTGSEEGALMSVCAAGVLCTQSGV